MAGLDPNTVISVLGLTLLGVGGLIGLLPIGKCASCAHCRLEAVAKERQRATGTGRFQRIPFCMVCGRYHQADEHHQR
jgi:hypothetical protein